MFIWITLVMKCGFWTSNRSPSPLPRFWQVALSLWLTARLGPVSGAVGPGLSAAQPAGLDTGLSVSVTHPHKFKEKDIIPTTQQNIEGARCRLRCLALLKHVSTQIFLFLTTLGIPDKKWNSEVELFYL